MTHDAVFVFFQVGFLVGGEVNGLLLTETVFLGQGFEPQGRPVTDGLFRQHGKPPFGDGSFPHELPFEIEYGAALRQHRFAQHLIFREPQRFGGLEHDEHMTGRLGMNEFVGNLDAERCHEVGMTFKKADMFMIRDGYQSIDLDGEVAPVLEKQFDRRDGQGSFEKLAHERALRDAFFPALNDFLVDLVDVSFGVCRAHLDAELGNDLAHVLRDV